MTVAPALVARPALTLTRARAAAVGVPALLGLAGFAVAVAFTWVPFGWADEAATQAMVTRPLGNVWQTVTTHVDAVHATYYLAMRLWAGVFGASIPVLRVPSAIAIGIATAGVHTLGKRLGGARVALLSAAAFITMPLVTWAAGEARSYGWTMAAAVWLTLALLRAIGGGKRAWVGYSVAAAACAYLFLYLLLVVLAHVAALLLTRSLRRSVRPALAAAGAAVVAALPLLLTASHEQEQIGWIPPFGPGIAPRVAAQWFLGAPGYELLAWLLIGAGVLLLAVGAVAVAGERTATLSLLVVWLALPTVLLVTATALGKPLYVPRYTVVSLPAAALLIGFACTRLKALAALVLLALGALAVPEYLHQRDPQANRTDWGLDAAFVQQHKAPGAGVYFVDTVRPQSPRRMMLEYAPTYAGLKDLGLDKTGAAERRIVDSVVAPAVAARRAQGLHEVLVVGDRWPAADLAATMSAFRAVGFHVRVWQHFPFTAAIELRR